MYLHDILYDYVRIPITQVRLRQFGKFWVVEYKMKNPKRLWDRFWWYDESLHSCPIEASARANVLVVNGYVEKYEQGKKFKVQPIGVKHESGTGIIQQVGNSRDRNSD